MAYCTCLACTFLHTYNCLLHLQPCHVMSLYVQDDFDCFLLACYAGKLKVVQELVNRYRMNPNVANEVSVFLKVYSAYRKCIVNNNYYADCSCNVISISIPQVWLDRCPSSSRIWVS